MTVRRVAAVDAIAKTGLWVGLATVGATLPTGRIDLILSTFVGAGLSVFNFRTLAAMLAAMMSPEGDPKGSLLVTMGVVAGQVGLFAVAVGLLLFAGLAHGVGLVIGLLVIPAACGVWFFTGRHDDTNENEATESSNVDKVNA